MKKNWLIWIASLALAMTFSIQGLATSKKEPFSGWKKLDPKARQVWQETNNEYIELIIKTTEPVKKTHKKAFKEAGFKYRSVVNNIVTGKILILQLPELAGLEFVKVIEGAMPLSIK